MAATDRSTQFSFILGAAMFLMVLAAPSFSCAASWRGKPPSRSEQLHVWSTIRRVARLEGLDARLMASIAIVESGDLNNRIVGGDGEIGLMQIMPATGRLVGVHPDALKTPSVNVRAAGRLLRRIKAQVSSPAVMRAAKWHPEIRRAGLAERRWLSAMAYNWGRLPYALTGEGSRANIPDSVIAYGLRVRNVYSKLK